MAFKSQFARIFEFVLCDFFCLFASAYLHIPDLGFKNLQCLIVAPVPPHKKVEQFVRVPVDFLELANGVQFLPDNLSG